MASSRAPKRRREHDGNDARDAPLVVFAPGARAPSTSPWMIRWKEMLRDALHAVEVVTFDYPYMVSGQRGVPPRAEGLVKYHTAIVKDAVQKYPGHPLILAGKSMGSRVSCMVAAGSHVDVLAVVCLGYPLKAPGGGALREEPLLQLKIPIMFTQGSKDALCPLETLGSVIKKMKVVNELYVIEGGDHSFKVGKKILQSAGSTQEDSEKQAVQAIVKFTNKILAGI